jgi:hypothetical protein
MNGILYTFERAVTPVRYTYELCTSTPGGQPAPNALEARPFSFDTALCYLSVCPMSCRIFRRHGSFGETKMKKAILFATLASFIAVSSIAKAEYGSQLRQHENGRTRDGVEMAHHKVRSHEWVEDMMRRTRERRRTARAEQWSLIFGNLLARGLSFEIAPIALAYVFWDLRAGRSRRY